MQQLDPPLVRIAAANGGTVSVRLHPAELGVVELHLDHGAAGQVRLTVRADRPDTLRLLGTERHRLDAALDRAGIKPGMIAFEPTRAAPAAPRHDGPAPLPAAHTHLPDASPHRSDPVTPIRDDRTATSGGWSNESRQQGDHSATRHSGDPDRSGRNRETASATRTAPRHGPAAPTSTAAGRQAGIDVTA